MKFNRSTVANLSSFVTVLCMAAIGWNTGALSVAVHEVFYLVSGDVELISNKPAPFWETVPAILSITALKVFTSLTLICLVTFVIGESRGQHTVSETLERKPNLSWFFLVPIGEEIFARWFFLDFLPNHFAEASGKTAFYALFILGNTIWALAHLDNYRLEQDQQWLRILPQFVGGIFLTYAFVKYGLMTTILIHLMMNASIFATSKSDDLKVADAYLLVFNLVCCLFSGFAISNSFDGVFAWLVGQSGEVLPGWDFDSYTLLFIFVRSFPEAVFTLLGYDRYGTNGRYGGAYAFWTTLVLAPLKTFIVFCVLWGADHALQNISLGVLVAGIIYIYPHQQSSGSTSARMLYTFLLTAYPCYRIINASDAEYLHLYLLLEALLAVPRATRARQVYQSGT